jgi:hypothetical protein
VLVYNDYFHVYEIFPEVYFRYLIISLKRQSVPLALVGGACASDPTGPCEPSTEECLQYLQAVVDPVAHFLKKKVLLT